jgi:hypothetical protein
MEVTVIWPRNPALAPELTRGDCGERLWMIERAVADTNG